MMDTKKRFIVAAVIVVIVLVGGYFVWKNRSSGSQAANAIGGATGTTITVDGQTVSVISTGSSASGPQGALGESCQDWLTSLNQLGVHAPQPPAGTATHSESLVGYNASDPALYSMDGCAYYSSTSVLSGGTKCTSSPNSFASASAYPVSSCVNNFKVDQPGSSLNGQSITQNLSTTVANVTIPGYDGTIFQSLQKTGPKHIMAPTAGTGDGGDPNMDGGSTG